MDPKICKIVFKENGWELSVDDQVIPFQSDSAAEYFEEHYSELGYSVLFIGQ